MNKLEARLNNLEKRIQALENRKIDQKEGMSNIAIWDQSTWDSGCVFA